jgi:hypothetical protein
MMQMAILVHLLFCSARYIIQWERYNYSIRNGSFFQAELRGPVKKKKNLGIIPHNNGQGDSDDKYHALIHQQPTTTIMVIDLV